MRHSKVGLLILLGLFLAVILALGWWNREALLALIESPAPTDQGRPPPLIEVAPVERAEIQVRLQATGTLKAAETVTLTARSRGRVEAVHFEEGSEVSKHQALVLLERKRAQAAVQEAAARVAQTARQLDRLETLDADAFVSETELEEARAAASEARAAWRVSSEDLADRIIEAPFDGLIGRRLISPGALLEPGMAIASLSRTAPLDLLLDVPGNALAKIETGQQVIATTPAYPQQRFEGRVTFVAPEVAENTRTLTLEATFDNADHRLKPGLFMTAELVTDRREILRVPEAAVIAQGPTNHLFVLDSQDADSQARVRRQPVQTGIRRDGWVEITRGVSADERVVVAGLQRLRDGIAVQIKDDPQRQSTQSPASKRKPDEHTEPAHPSPGSSSDSSAGAPAGLEQATQGDSP
ncbi:MAG: efflux RND transporter periplasmic adaptor subunit [Lamprobacter sp.]|uniref:efflux RND transporter periplasmic adaptor subunit n=1 Tax=Lamprobacter sp. TaxID=3100796 RepID=UPI002B25D670|nr:efflux RND transporter periplasmic adaptor subunit [Lamprobacter sp.]MEA3642508.1 efflux RND transporter periplasmic adaptor subunit [Lamprobacter sp.]